MGVAKGQRYEINGRKIDDSAPVPVDRAVTLSAKVVVVVSIIMNYKMQSRSKDICSSPDVFRSVIDTLNVKMDKQFEW